MNELIQNLAEAGFFSMSENMIASQEEAAEQTFPYQVESSKRYFSVDPEAVADRSPIALDFLEYLADSQNRIANAFFQSGDECDDIILVIPGGEFRLSEIAGIDLVVGFHEYSLVTKALLSAIFYTLQEDYADCFLLYRDAANDAEVIIVTEEIEAALRLHLPEEMQHFERL